MSTVPGAFIHLTSLASGLVLSSLAGCSSPSTSPRIADAGGDAAGTAGDQVVGTFGVILVAPDPGTGTPGYTSVQGKVHDGPVPSPILWKLAAEENGCQLYVPRIPFCDPPCGGGSVCADDRSCVRQPTVQNLGKVNVRGLGDRAFDMDPIQGDYSPPGEVQLPNPPCPEGADVRLQTSGGAIAPFALEGKCIVPIQVPSKGPLPLAPDQPLRLSWMPATRPELGRIRVKVEISHHGGQKGRIDCDLADSGAFEVPLDLTSRLLSLGVAGFPTVTVARVSSGSMRIATGVVELLVSSGVEIPLAIPGVTSCNRMEECPAGKTCQSDRTCR